MPKTMTRRSSHIRHEQLYGIEYQDDLQTLAMTNMIIRNDGHSHIFKGDSFDYTMSGTFIDQNLSDGAEIHERVDKSALFAEKERQKRQRKQSQRA
jgi:hypothetical protein